MSQSQKEAQRLRMRANKHELYCLSLEEFDEVVAQRSRTVDRSGVKQTWQDFKGTVEDVAGYTATGKDLTTLTKVFADLGFAGTKAYVFSNQRVQRTGETSRKAGKGIGNVF